jgi:pteridine reductase
MVEAVAQRFGRLDALVTTASIWESTPLAQVSAEDMLKSFQVNTLGTFLCARRAGLMMVDQPQGGAIVTFGDWAIQRPYLDHAAYFTAKGGVEALTRSLAVELAHRNPRVRVNCIHPGPVMFPPESSEDERAELVESTLVKSGDCPESIARGVSFLLREHFVTGTSLHIDGGRSIYAGEATSRKRPI